MASDTYTLVYDFSTLGKFGEPHPRYNLQDLPVMASKLASEEKDKVEEIVSKSWKRNFVAFYHSQITDTHAYIFTDAAKDAKLIVLAFRGTTSIQDWLTDFHVTQTQVDTVSVHSGFWSALSLGDVTTVYKAAGLPEPKIGQPFEAIRDTLIQLATDHPDAKILVTGHSLGGALALIFTFKLSREHEQKYKGILSSNKYKVVTFGQPLVGDPNFRDYINSLGLNYTRVVNKTDIVPRLPPNYVKLSHQNYSHVGILLHYFSKDGSPGNPLDDHGISGYVSHTTETLDAVEAAELLWADPPWARFNPLVYGEEVLGLERKAVSFCPTPSSNPSILGGVEMVHDEQLQKMRVKMLEVMRQDRLTSISAVGEEVKEVPAKAITPLP